MLRLLSSLPTIIIALNFELSRFVRHVFVGLHDSKLHERQHPCTMNKKASLRARETACSGDTMRDSVDFLLIAAVGKILIGGLREGKTGEEDLRGLVRAVAPALRARDCVDSECVR